MVRGANTLEAEYTITHTSRSKLVKTCFVIMSFDEAYDKVYHQAIKPAVEICKHKCMRADSSNAPANIISEIVRKIIDADVVDHTVEKLSE